MSELFYSSHLSASDSQCCNGSPTVPGSYWFLGKVLPGIIDGSLHGKGSDLLRGPVPLWICCTVTAFGGLLGLSLTRDLESELVLLKWKCPHPKSCSVPQTKPRLARRWWKRGSERSEWWDWNWGCPCRLHKAPDPGLGLLKASRGHPHYLPIFLGFSQLPASSPTVSILHTLTFYVFSWLNYQNEHWTLGSTVGLDLALVYVSAQFWKKKVET